VPGQVAGDLNMSIVPSDPLLRREAAAAYLGVAPRFLERRATAGDGPEFVRLSSRLIAYRQSALDSWLEQRAVNSTSEGK
jgi:predicted DNA-binding transcriptional regulator AlpA